MATVAIVDTLEHLLLDAERSHVAHEQLHGPTDWPPYYAGHLHRALGDRYDLEQVTRALREAAAAHGRFEEAQNAGRDEEWPRWYAEHMAATLGRDWLRTLADADSWGA